MYEREGGIKRTYGMGDTVMGRKEVVGGVLEKTVCAGVEVCRKYLTKGQESGGGWVGGK